MAVEVLQNPRRAPRARVRCAVSVSTGDAPPLRAFSEDLGPHGCQLVAPRTFSRGSTLRLELHAEEAPEALRAIGTVAWASPSEPWRVGMAFGESSRPSAARFFDALVARRPGLAAWRKVPDRISYDAMIWLAPPPRLVVDFTAAEVGVLRAVGSGATLHELRSRLRDGWKTGLRSFYSLLSSGFITLSRGGSVPYSNWSGLLGRLESEQAVAALAPAPARPTRAVAAVAPPTPPRAAPNAPTRTLPAVQARPPAANDGAAGLDLELDLERECEPEREPDGAALEGPDDLRDWPAAPPGGPAAWPPIPPGKGRG